MFSIAARIFARNPPAILIVIGGFLAFVNNPYWSTFLGWGIVLRVGWLLLMGLKSLR